MTGNLSLLPAIVVDCVGSAMMLVLSILSMRYGFLLSRRQPENFLWSYLFYITVAIAAFSTSRAVGHLVKEFLLISGNRLLWERISPYSGGLNTLFMVSLAAVMVFYHKGVQAYDLLQAETERLKIANQQLAETSAQLHDLNRNLEKNVEDRTRELSRSEEKYRHLFSASQDVVLFCDAGGAIVDINEAGLRTLGYAETAILGHRFTKFMVRPEEFVRCRRQLAEDGRVKDFDVELRRGDDSPLPLLLSATAVHNEDGSVIGCEMIGKDLSRLKQMMSQLAASENMASIGQMAAGVAHELKTPLGVILGYTQLLKEDFPADSEHHQSLAAIERQTKASRKIVSDLLKFSRQSRSAREPVDINGLLDDVVITHGHDVDSPNLTVKTDYGHGLPMVSGDAAKLRQVFVNLLKNACQAVRGRADAWVRLSSLYDAEAQAVLIDVEDNGPGIPASDRERVFEPFFTTKLVGEGTGLGLSVSYGIVKEHGGVIELANNSSPDPPPGGSRFRVCLPVDGQKRLKHGESDHQCEEVGMPA
ncbi:MAG: PAS domain-containing protein [Desulfobulbaceae bacterium]|jgi:PAS domain S-box-containing protein|nr:PAS domain-containing protein [Desulfobulbaceae bacterium]